VTISGFAQRCCELAAPLHQTIVVAFGVVVDVVVVDDVVVVVIVAVDNVAVVVIAVVVCVGVFLFCLKHKLRCIL
jgi:hypothetical protein